MQGVHVATEYLYQLNHASMALLELIRLELLALYCVAMKMSCDMYDNDVVVIVSKTCLPL